MVVMADDGKAKLAAHKLETFIYASRLCIQYSADLVKKFSECVNTLSEEQYSFNISSQTAFSALSTNLNDQVQAFVVAREPLIFHTLDVTTLDAETQSCLKEAVFKNGVEESDASGLPDDIDPCLPGVSSLTSEQIKDINDAFMDNITKARDQLYLTLKDYYDQYVEVI